ncbi:hypothetical protein LEP1GSC137_1162 [Leptospira borgpetersenii str. Noumea 25]|uniref:Uncharacterized protein n=1 Tax=Leptospira borgpetersenii str. 200701203 TaxID=1193007 RepID=M3GBH3_LEPBO|nr:hypothetical protein LEP1GSC123_1765 [Leptospira borgpetersenii str. 200701203]EMO07610.1 hypothetical protein LEP1GSC137_1162 [Leptospira borgpetersenii str. Noumea 25]
MNLWAEKISRRKLFGFGVGGLLSIGVGTFFFRRSKNQSLPKTLFFPYPKLNFYQLTPKPFYPKNRAFPISKKRK